MNVPVGPGESVSQPGELNPSEVAADIMNEAQSMPQDSALALVAEELRHMGNADTITADDLSFAFTKVFEAAKTGWQTPLSSAGQETRADFDIFVGYVEAFGLPHTDPNTGEDSIRVCGNTRLGKGQVAAVFRGVNGQIDDSGHPTDELYMLPIQTDVYTVYIQSTGEDEGYRVLAGAPSPDLLEYGRVELHHHQGVSNHLGPGGTEIVNRPVPGV